MHLTGLAPAYQHAEYALYYAKRIDYEEAQAAALFARNIGLLTLATRRANASDKPLFHLGHNLCLSHFIGSFHCYNTYADLVSLHPLFQFALCLTGAKYQNRFCITDARNYLIVVICEMPHIISFLRIICRN